MVVLAFLQHPIILGAAEIHAAHGFSHGFGGCDPRSTHEVLLADIIHGAVEVHHPVTFVKVLAKQMHTAHFFDCDILGVWGKSWEGRDVS